jgi:hypothetical protein
MTRCNFFQPVIRAPDAMNMAWTVVFLDDVPDA